METKDLWLLLAGAAVGYVINLMATFTAPSVGSAFGKLKSGFIERNKANALAAYAEVWDLNSGKRDKYLYAINGWGFISSLTLAGHMGTVVGLAAGRAFGPTASTVRENAPALWLFVLAFATFLLFLVAWRALRLVLTLGRLANFEDYRAELLRRWPDAKLPDHE
jgi:hypothetical protein